MLTPKHILEKTSVPVIFAIVLLVSGSAAAIFIGGFGGGTATGLQDGLVGHWKLDGNPNDSTIYNNHGTVNGDGGGVVLGESGTFTSRPDAGWKKIEFANSYTTPVVVGTNNTHNGENALVFESRNVTNTSAEMRLCESEGSTTGCDTHESETAGYVIIDADDAGSVAGIEAGIFDIDGEMDTTSTTVSFGETFGTAPEVMTAVNTINGTAPVEGQAHSVTTTDFVGAICQQNGEDSCDDTHPTETVGWVAVEPDNEPFNEQAEANSTGDNVSNSTWTSQTFASAFSEPPVMIVETQTNDGGQDALVDEVRNITTTDTEVRYCEMDSGDTCDTHLDNDVGWLAVERGVLTTGNMPAHPNIDRNHNKNGAYEFDSSNDYIDLGVDTLDRSSTQDWSVSFWVNPDEFATGTYRGIIGNNFSTNNAWAIEIRENSGVYLELNGDSGNRDRTGTSAVGFEQWNHIVATYDASTTTATIHANAGNGNSTDYTDTGDFDSGHAEIGRRPDSDSRYFGGQVDDVRLYDRKLSSDDISQLYDSYNPGTRVASTQKNLVSHWKMDGNGNDATPYSNHGTVNGATATTDRHGQSGGALDFDGTDDDITGTSQPKVQTNPNLFTVSGFINPGNQYSRFITPQSIGIDQWIGYDETNERLQVTVAEDANTNLRFRYSSTDSIPLNTWTHWAVVINGKTIKIYINGELDQEYNESISIAGWNNEWRIGQRGNDTYWLLGKLDDIRVHGRELTPSEISDLNDSYNPTVQVSDLQKDLKGNWTFNGDAKDKTPYSNHGTLQDGDPSNGDGDTPPQLTTDRHGGAERAYSFDGTDDYMNLGDKPEFEFDSGQSFSATFWIKPTASANNSSPLNKHYGVQGQKRPWYLFRYRDSTTSNDINFMVRNSGGTDAQTNAGVNLLNEWHHVAGVYDGSADELRLYVDGMLKGTATSVPTGAYGTNDGFLEIGSHSNDFFPGAVDDVRIYDRALSSVEVETLFQIYH